ncbi:outer membrane assembly protein, AsmA_2 superfamily [Psychroflexus torquis ATCC 700755]|uniref:Outer membrane assembly protein, AsmA_2 superfamily n=1 Tax=Psychroflexus torquis (strain ATCC 700755 / CIP 106069 / ACAM 623) TaxID=313595 RepID=K4IJJ3_PSYTT|nr:AsmA family protein [Psychroflexus torquis]AFU70494.1 outer membrane assembly protein, AsmA_2 superfamily [Psychroflexus torquis ATCC 700755]
MKKAFKIIGIVILILIIGLFLTPILFKGSIEKMLKNAANDNVNAQVEWSSLNLSLFRNFPNASVSLEDLSLVNKAPFEGDTLVYAKNFNISMGIMQLFKDEGLSIDEIYLNEAYMNVKVDSLGNANYDIAKSTDVKQEATTKGKESKPFNLNLSHYEINSSRINYLDESGNIFLRLTEFSHSGDGNFEASVFTLKTQTESKVSFDFDGTNYLNANSLVLDADLNIDLENMKFSFLENEAIVNQLPLKFEGYVQTFDDYNDIDIKFSTPSSDFKNFLALIPEAYASNLDGVTTTGDFQLNGIIKGKVDDTYIPTLDISASSDNASFQYPDLPKKVEDISLDIRIQNETGLVEDTYIKFKNVDFRIDQDRFAGSGSVKNLTTNMLVNLKMKGRLNLANLKKAYPVDIEQDLSGILDADITTNFDMNSIEQDAYENVKAQGSMKLSKFDYESPDLAELIHIETATVNFTTNAVQLNSFEMTAGSTDLQMKGDLSNLMGFAFSDKPLQGIFNATSTNFNIADFTVDSEVGNKVNESGNPTTETASTGPEGNADAIKIPDFLDIVLNFNAKTVIYDNLTLKNAKGSLALKNESAILKNVNADIFGGSISLDGKVTTSDVPNFDMKLGLTTIKIVEAFQQMELVKGLAPIAQALNGLASTTIDLNGNLTKDLMPIYTSLAGSALANILSAEVEQGKMPLISNLNSQFKVLNFDKLKVKDLVAKLNFKNGAINADDFDFNLDDVKVDVSGSHSFDNTMNYNLSFNVPAKYFGNEVGGQLAQLSNTDLSQLNVDVPVGLTGTFSNPKIQLTMQNAIKDLTSKIVDAQKEKATNAIKDKIGDEINNLLGGDKKEKDSTKTQQEDVKDVVKDILGDIFKKKKDN